MTNTRAKLGLISSIVLAVSSLVIISSNQIVNAVTCHGIGKAKTTFRPGSITSSELRNTTEWNYNCSTGFLSSPVSLTNHHVYWNPAIDITSNYWSAFYNTLALPNYLFGKMAGSFEACDSYICGSGYYSFTLHNYVYTTNYDLGNSVRSCWVSGTTSYMPGYTLSCGT